MKPAAFICLVFVAVILSTLVLPMVATQTPTEPPEPKPTATVQKILDEAAQLTKEKQPQEARAAADRALTVAKDSKDAVGEAQAHRARGQTLQSLNKNEEA